MIKDLVKEFVASEFHNTTVIEAIEHKLGRKLVKGQDRVLVDYTDGGHKETETPIEYGAVIHDGQVYGFLSIDYSEPCIIFTPGPALLPLK